MGAGSRGTQQRRAAADGAALAAQRAPACFAPFAERPPPASPPAAQEDGRDFSDEWVICRWVLLGDALQCRCSVVPLWLICQATTVCSTLCLLPTGAPCALLPALRSVYNAGHEVSHRYNEV